MSGELWLVAAQGSDKLKFVGHFLSDILVDREGSVVGHSFATVGNDQLLLVEQA